MHQVVKDYKKEILISLLALFFGLVLPDKITAQDNLAIGQWRMHLPFNKLHTVAEGNGNVYHFYFKKVFLKSELTSK